MKYALLVLTCVIFWPILLLAYYVGHLWCLILTGFQVGYEQTDDL